MLRFAVIRFSGGNAGRQLWKLFLNFLKVRVPEIERGEMDDGRYDVLCLFKN